MSSTFAFLITTVAAAVLFLVLDFAFWGTKWVREKIYSKVPKEMWSGMLDADGKVVAGGAMWLGSAITAFVAVVFVPMVWMLGPQFAGARVLLLAALLWAAFDLPGALYCGIYYRFPASYVKLQALAGLVRVVLGLVLVTWLLTVFRVW